MIWVGIGIGLGIGALVIFAFWLGQRSATVVQAESRKVAPSTDPPVKAPEPPVVVPESDDAPDVDEASEPEKVDDPPAPAMPSVEEKVEELPSAEPEAAMPVPNAAELQRRNAELLAKSKPTEEHTLSPTRRRWVGTAATLCGAVNTVRETFPAGTRGEFRYKGSPSEGWKAHFALRDDEIYAVPRRSRDPKAPTNLSLEELPDLLAADEWTKVFDQVATGDAILETPVWPGLHKQRRPVRWMSVTDPTFCGAVNGIRDSRPYGSSVTLEWNLTSKREWWVWDTNFGSQERAADRDFDNDEWFKREEERKVSSGERHEADSFKPSSYRERRSHSSGKTRHCKWDIYVGSFEPTTANNSRGGLDKFGRNPDTEHLGTWRDDL